MYGTFIQVSTERTLTEMTSEYTIRLLTMDDAAQAAKLWSLVFGDEEPLVLEFFRLFAHQPGFGACAEQDGNIVAAAYCPGDMDYTEPNGTVHAGAYLYAVATHPNHRKQGLAQAVCRLLQQTAWEQGRKYMFTRPSEESLYAWYEEKIGAVPLMGGQKLHFERADGVCLPHRQLSPEDYLALRIRALSGLPHVHQGLRWMQWEQLLHNQYGGGFFTVGDHIADIYSDGNSLTVNELLPHPTPQQAKEICRALMSATNTSKCECLISGNEKYVSVAANGCDLPDCNPWFGPCFG